MSRLWSLVPVIIDGAFIVAFHLAVPALALRFGHQDPGNALLIGVGYTAVCVAAFLLKRLGQGEKSSSFSESGGLAGTTGMFFGFFVLFMADQTSGFSSSVTTSGDGQGTVIPTLIAIGGIALALAFPIILFLKPGHHIKTGTTRYHLSHAVALVLVNTMVLLLLAFWRAYFEADPEPYEDLTMRAKILIFVFVYIVYLLFLSAPRLLLLSLDFRAPALASFLISSAYFVWNSLSRAAW